MNVAQNGRAHDPVKFLQAAEQRARERQVAYETVRILRKDVIECYRKAGSGHGARSEDRGGEGIPFSRHSLPVCPDRL